ncbi:MAG: SDR family oxidoreductase [Planctomycetota bacterium]
MPIDLTDKPIAITGASSGIGRATAIACAAAGMPVALGARRVDKLDAVKVEIESAGGRAITVPMDVAHKPDSTTLVDRTNEAFGPIYAVFANAGFGFEARSDRVPEDRLREIFEVNFFGSLHTVHAALPTMLEHSRGHAIICSSCIGKLPVPYFGAYCATKAAQWHMASALRWELRSKGIFASSVHPVGTKTEFFDRARERSKPPPEAGSTIDDHTPSWLMQRPETVAHAIVGCLRRPRGEVWPSWARAVQLGMAISQAVPSLPGFFFRAGMVKKQEAREKGAH